ncbi:calcineurin-like phosphoesterase C-terminal domain-containing protein [Oceanicaulis sp.]|uniref:calcineurin-like phosphoesterase C-terminal domain-containing protein n=1 Tax=Oceanicaulis sp. TaxID=1924941 RepID=UPI003D2A09B3
MSRFALSVSMVALWAGLHTPALAQPYMAAPEVIGAAGGETISGVVFEDLDRNGRHDRSEPGVEGVRVSNGRDWVITNAAGQYEIAVRPDMNLTFVQPSGWQAPVDHRNVPQFSYIHKPGGTGYSMRFGGLPDTGPAPEAVNFPIIRRPAETRAFSCAVVGDSQTYSNQEVSWFRDGVVQDLAEMDLTDQDCALYVGDVVGDDLGLLDRLLEVGSVVGAPQWLVHGNHDFDFDAQSDADSADSWRRIYGPNYFAFEMGDVLFVALDNVVYPCGPEDYASGHDFCAPDARPTYNGRVTQDQLVWLEGLIESTPSDMLIVLSHHIPFVSFVDSTSDKHQTDNLDRIHDLVSGHQALSLSGHTHSTENHAPGQVFDGWTENTGTGPLPFRHIVAGAASGAWYAGDLNVDGNPMSLQRMGAPNGVVMLDFDGVDYAERYVGARIDETRGQWVGVSTPSLRAWYDAIMAWRAEDRDARDPVPPLSINDLPDPNILTLEELADGVWVTANVWMGSSETQLSGQIANGPALSFERTQSGAGEAPRIGADWADPFAVQRQLSVARYAMQSRSGDERAQGVFQWQGRQTGPAAPQPQNSVADRNMHLWRAMLPADLGLGVHAITVTSTDRNGLEFEDTIIVEVREARPQPTFRTELWAN